MDFFLADFFADFLGAAFWAAFFLGAGVAFFLPLPKALSQPSAYFSFEPMRIIDTTFLRQQLVFFKSFVLPVLNNRYSVVKVSPLREFLTIRAQIPR